MCLFVKIIVECCLKRMDVHGPKPKAVSMAVEIITVDCTVTALRQTIKEYVGQTKEQNLLNDFRVV